MVAASSIKGELGFEADGVRFVVVYDSNAMCALEAEVDTDAMGIIALVQKPRSFRNGRLLLWGGLQQHHPDLTLADAGRLMTAVGGLGKAYDMVSEALILAFPPPPDLVDGAKADGEEAGEGDRPLKARTGTKTSRARAGRGTGTTS